MPRRKNECSILKGIGAAPGIAIGPAFLLNSSKVRILRRSIDDSDIPGEQERFEKAVSDAEQWLNRLLDEMPEELKGQSGIFQAHLLMLRDRMIYNRTLDIIADEGINAEWALDTSLEYARRLFEQVKDTYIRERISDLEYVVERILQFLSGSPVVDFGELDEPVVIVAHDLSPADTIQMKRDKVLAFVTEVGSRTSHTAILARSLGIAAVVGVEGLTSGIFSGEMVIVDGLAGQVIISPDDDRLARLGEKQDSYLRYRLEAIHFSGLPAETRDGYRLKVKANMELTEEVPSIVANGAEGIGLFRTEFLYLARKNIPTEEQLFATYREVVESMSPYPTTIRTLDIGGDKLVSAVSLDEEVNPALGLRAIRLCLEEKELFKTQLRAILRASVFGSVKILFPMISGRMEIVKVKRFLEEVMEAMTREGIPFDEDVKLGIMIEVPTAVMVADFLAEEVDFFSIGTNDLIQYGLAIDRVNEYVAHLYEPLHPGVLRMIKQAVDAAHQSGIAAAMCGEMAGEPMYVPVLVGMGLDELSMNSLSIPRIKRLIRQVDQEQCSNLVKELLESSTGSRIREILLDFLKSKFPDEFGPAIGLYPDFWDMDA